MTSGHPMPYRRPMAIPGDDPRLDATLAPDPSHAEPFPTLEEAMRRHIEAALARCKGRIEGERGAARLLAIHANTLRSRMHKLGIRWERFR